RPDPPAGQARRPREQGVELAFGVRAIVDVREIHPGPDVRDVGALPEHPGVPAGRAAAEVDVVVPRIAVDAYQGVLQAGIDVPRPEVCLESGPATDLALEPVRADPARTAHGQPLAPRP